MRRILELISGFRGGVATSLVVAVGVAACGEDSGAPTPRPSDPLVGNWGITTVVQDGEVTYSGPGDEGYWVIYQNQTVCLIELLPSGDYEKDSTFVYEHDRSQFIMRFDLDPIPAPPDTLTFRLSAASDTLYFEGGPTADRPAMELVLVRQDSIPDCGCDAIR